MNYNCSNSLYLRNLQEQVKKAFCYQKMFWPFTVWINRFSDLKKLANSQPSASNFKSFSPPLEHFFLAVGQNNFGNKIPFLKTFLRLKILVLMIELYWVVYTESFPFINWLKKKLSIINTLMIFNPSKRYFREAFQKPVVLFWLRAVIYSNVHTSFFLPVNEREKIILITLSP